MKNITYNKTMPVNNEWMNRPAGFDAMWIPEFMKSHNIVGCPLGWGKSQYEAAIDLCNRTNAESKTKLDIEFINY